MAHFAELDENNIVKRVVVVDDAYEADGENWCANFFGGRWKQTSYNGKIRKNYAGVGYKYDEGRDAFIAPKPYPSWILDNATAQWVAPVAKPDGLYEWHEPSGSWVGYQAASG